ncbi:nicotinate phosphoribosyltransferase [Sneathiella chinensis]|uniref:Nicotinate phosphoribosyltransferase n=1 Tax=Sneathiella chinensis TaxID=349750 RepID=A0ABQ5U5I1_9PROT|nr:nicotinate phosphoribosyltransferase [Sneathiella chinensis]GLQ07021.1 nicotinate phosphoribosyltransferase [Sneathiella chinensis]
MNELTATTRKSAIEQSIADHTDQYFNRTKKVVQKFGDKTVTYAVFMRRPVIFCPRLMVEWMTEIASLRGQSFEVEPCFNEGDWVGAGEPLFYITGSFVDLADLETLYLQKIGPACVAAYNAYLMCCHMPDTAFLAMDARHSAGAEMAEMMAYAASVGSRAAQTEHGAIGFIGNANNSTAHYFGNNRGMGTMPHALIGYAGSTLRAAEMFVESYPDEPLTVLVDYFGQEITDALAVCRRFPEMAAEGRLSVRMDTHGGRFIEGLDPAQSYAVLERNMPKGIRQYRSEQELKWLVGTGVSAAAIYYMREQLDEAGFDKVRIVASSGFSADKCSVMGSMKAPIDVIGTGSFLPESWSETYATADVISYDGVPSVKLGREFLLKKDK